MLKRTDITALYKEKRYSKMRKELKKLDGQRLMFSAVVDGFGKRYFKDKEMPTIVFRDVKRLSDELLVADHLWFTQGLCWSDLKTGQRVQFEARVKAYEKGYKGRREVVGAPIRTDYKLERPTKVQLISDDL